MSKEYTEGQSFKNENYSEKALPKGEYENCTFTGCTFANTDLSGYHFVECVFENCDMSMAKLRGTVFKDVLFKGCKLLGLHFNDCNGFIITFRFESCLLNFSSFYRLKLKSIRFTDCRLEEVDFVEADLTNAAFLNCDLNRAVFRSTILEGADFRSAYNFSIDPEANRISKSRFALHSVAGLLDKYKITIE
ncbi:pentapeptide repeat-containing protein [Telluribacter sp. SYSU D00476]|uniref:pentapeptide repeat-containing protein n=1 Tax=Telluribacter sp. SYSU D00476 TaxID=2811430 RepID=UPI001FF2B2C0|nr:pentapeptide repeat-containing protein [Telluribacter sp. SYSU D00476]